MAKYTVEFDTNDKQEEALLELLPYWQQYTSKEDGSSRPFEHYTIADLFEVLMQIGSLHTIWNKIEEEQFRQGQITIDEWLDKEHLTIAERKEKRQQTQKEGACV